MNKNKLKTLSDRLAYALEITGMKKADLARAIDVQPQTIQHLCNGNVKSSRFTFELATALGLDTTWLATGEGQAFLSDNPKNHFFDDYKIIPVLDSQQLTTLALKNTFNETTISEWATLKTAESNLFCVTMHDPSMSPFIPKGAKLFFKKPAKKEKLSGIVIAYLPSFDSILIRDYQQKNNSVFLSPKNTTLFREIELPTDAVIFGLAIECQFSINTVRNSHEVHFATDASD